MRPSSATATWPFSAGFARVPVSCSSGRNSTRATLLTMESGPIVPSCTSRVVEPSSAGNSIGERPEPSISTEARRASSVTGSR